MSPLVYLFRKMTLFNLVSQMSKVQLAPHKGNIWYLRWPALTPKSGIYRCVILHIQYQSLVNCPK